MDFQERLETVLRDPNKRSNCYGTAMFLAGATEKEFPMGYDETEGRRARLKLLNLNQIVVPCLVVYVSKLPDSLKFLGSHLDCAVHMAVLTSIDPLLTAERNGNNGPFLQNQTIPLDKAHDAGQWIEFRQFPERPFYR